MQKSLNQSQITHRPLSCPYQKEEPPGASRWFFAEKIKYEEFGWFLFVS
jgi:hypothetical protein